MPVPRMLASGMEYKVLVGAIVATVFVGMAIFVAMWLWINLPS